MTVSRKTETVLQSLCFIQWKKKKKQYRNRGDLYGGKRKRKRNNIAIAVICTVEKENETISLSR